MKKNTLKAFTLVEMLIVIVIIGILIAALMPRMQAAQWRARDVSRKTALSQLQSAIVTSQGDKWKWPGIDAGAGSWIWISKISWDLIAAGMNSIPKDPLENTVSMWSNFQTGSTWDYAYLVATRNWAQKWWFVLMAQTEVEWWSNWAYCGAGIGSGQITGGTDIAQIHICQSLDKTWTAGSCHVNTDECTYTTDNQLRYIVIY